MKKEVADNLAFLSDIGAMERTETQDSIRLDNYTGEHREMLRRKYFVGPYGNTLVNPWFHTDKFTKSMIQKDFKCKINFDDYRNNEELYGQVRVDEAEMDLEEMGMAMPDHFRVDPMVEESDTSPKATLDVESYNALEEHLKQGLKKRFIMLLNYDTYFSFYRAITNTYLINGFVYEYQNYQIKSAVKEIAKQLADTAVVEFLKVNRDTSVYRDKSTIFSKDGISFEIIPNEFEPEFIRTYQSALQALYGFKMTPDTNIEDFVKTISTDVDMREEVLYLILPQEINLRDLHQDDVEDEVEELVEVE